MQLQRKLLAALIAGALLGAPAWAAINTSGLGAAYDATKANVTFKVYSSRRPASSSTCTAAPPAAPKKRKYVMTLGTAASGAVTIPTATLSGQGLGGTLYYGYRAWGPNWPYNASWTKGSSDRLRQRRRRQRQPLQPEQAAVRPLRARAEPRPDHADQHQRHHLRQRRAVPQHRQRHLRPERHRARRRHPVDRRQADPRAEGRRHLRSPCARPDDERHRHHRRLPRHLQGRGVEGGLPGQPGRDRDRIPAGAGNPERHQRQRSEQRQRGQLLGLHDPELFRAGPPLRLRQNGRAARPASSRKW
jgi:hypothetical protein